MSVFISWSGKDSRSHRLAQLLKIWLPKVIQRLPCYLSSSDIEAGEMWLNNLFENLERSSVGIICVTTENWFKPWLSFEAGALAKKLKTARVCPLLIDIEPAEVQMPLAAFQLKTLIKEDIYSILEMVNLSQGESALEDMELREAFETRWPEFEKTMNGILAAKTEQRVIAPKRSTDDVLHEVLSIVRGISSKLPVEIESQSSVGQAGITDSEMAFAVWKKVVATAKQQRPLIVEWLNSAFGAVVLNGKFLALFNPVNELASEMCNRPNNRKFILGLLSEFGVTDFAASVPRLSSPKE